MGDAKLLLRGAYAGMERSILYFRLFVKILETGPVRDKKVGMIADIDIITLRL